MQYNFFLKFKLDDFENLKRFVEPEEANIVLASQTAGACIICNANNYKNIVIDIPKLKSSSQFVSSDTMELITYNLVVYNLACSLKSCSLVHSINSENEFCIEIITDSKADFDQLEGIKNRFKRKSKLFS